MRITVDPEAAPRVGLEDAENFREFSVVNAAPPAGLDAALRRAGAGEYDGEHAWLDPAWVRSAAHGDATWEQGFASMVGYALSKGWTDSRGFIRAHIVGPDAS